MDAKDVVISEHRAIFQELEDLDELPADAPGLSMTLAAVLRIGGSVLGRSRTSGKGR